MKKIVTNDGKKGGWLKGKPHYDKNGKSLGGIKAIVTDQNNRPVELEGGEVIINKEASAKHWKELSRINQSAGNGVAIGPPGASYDEDPEEHKEGGRVIEFNANHVPNKWILQYAKSIKEKHPEIWKLGGNIFGNEAFKNLKRVSERGYWLDSEKWMYIKWRSYVARHKKDFRIEGVVAMLKWVDKVEKGWPYMKNLIEEKISKIKEREKGKGWKHKMKDGGRTIAQTPAPKKDRIYGSDVNKPGSASSKESAKSIELGESTINSIKSIIKGTGISLATAKAVVRRGMGAYSSSHRPTISGGKPNSRVAWGLARLNAFVYKKEHGRSKSGKYTQDDDLMEIGGNMYHLGGDMSKHFAPNGKPSNLTHEQWHLVRTAEFKAWFGDWENDPKNASKVVDENGEPLVVYHRTNKKFNVFDKDRLGQNTNWETAKFGFYFSNENENNKYGKKVIKCFLNIRDPYDISTSTLSNFDFQYKDFDPYIFELGNNDGIILKIRILEYDQKSNKHFVAFESNQIKLADGTNTTFDANNPDIRYKDGGELAKGIKTEQEHKKTLEGIASGKYTVDEAIKMTAKDHLKEDPKYYTKLLKMEEKMSKGGTVTLNSGYIVKEGDIGTYTGRLNVKIKVTSISNTRVSFIEEGGEKNSKSIENFKKQFVPDKTEQKELTKTPAKTTSKKEAKLRFKTESELRKEYGLDFRTKVRMNSVGAMDWMFGKSVEEITNLPKDEVTAKFLNEKKIVLDKKKSIDKRAWTLYPEMLTVEPLIETPTSKFDINDIVLITSLNNQEAKVVDKIYEDNTWKYKLESQGKELGGYFFEMYLELAKISYQPTEEGKLSFIEGDKFTIKYDEGSPKRVYTIANINPTNDLVTISWVNRNGDIDSTNYRFKQIQEAFKKGDYEKIYETPIEGIKKVEKEIKKVERVEKKEKPKPTENTIQRLDEWVNMNMKDVITMPEDLIVTKVLADLALSLSSSQDTKQKNDSVFIFEMLNKK